MLEFTNDAFFLALLHSDYTGGRSVRIPLKLINYSSYSKLQLEHLSDDEANNLTVS